MSPLITVKTEDGKNNSVHFARNPVKTRNRMTQPHTRAVPWRATGNASGKESCFPRITVPSQWAFPDTSIPVSMALLMWIAHKAQA